MQPVFWRVNHALSDTVDYYKKGRIASHLRKFGGELNLSYLDSYVELVYKWHEHMEAEIQQIIHTTNKNTQVELFEFLKTVIGDSRIKSVDVKLINDMVDEYNELEYTDFLKKVEVEYAKFLDGKPFEKEMNEITTKEVNPSWMFGGLLGTGYKIERINRHFHCIEAKAEWADTKYIPDYIKLITPIIDNARTIISKYVQRYEQGKISPTQDTVIINQPNQIEEKKIAEIENNMLSSPKIKVNITAGQLVAFFRLLYDIEPAIFNIQDQSELRVFIINNFITKKTKGTSMNDKKTANHFSSPDAKDIKHWMNILKKMGDNAAKF